MLFVLFASSIIALSHAPSPERNCTCLEHFLKRDTRIIARIEGAATRRDVESAYGETRDPDAALRVAYAVRLAEMEGDAHTSRLLVDSIPHDRVSFALAGLLGHGETLGVALPGNKDVGMLERFLSHTAHAIATTGYGYAEFYSMARLTEGEPLDLITLNVEYLLQHDRTRATKELKAIDSTTREILCGDISDPACE